MFQKVTDYLRLIITHIHSADRTLLQKPITWKRLLQYISKNSRWIHNFDKRLLTPFSEKRCLACNFQKKCLQLIFRHARWVPFLENGSWCHSWGKSFINLLLLLQIIFWYHLSEIYIRYPFLKSNARYMILKIAVSWYIQVTGFSYLCRFWLCIRTKYLIWHG